MKSELRERYRLVRDKAKNKESDLVIYNKLINSNEFKECNMVLTYVSINSEVDTLMIIEKCFEMKKIVAVPKCVDNVMNFYVINSFDDLKEGYYNILEPVTNKLVLDFSNSICITPGIVFDNSNNRLGYGGGYYDRFFEHYTGIKIGLCYKECIISLLEVSEYDKKVDIIIHN